MNDESKEITSNELEKINLIEVAEKTMLGDLISLLIQEMRIMPRTWAYLSEQEQDAVICRAESACRTAIHDAIEIIASKNHETVSVTVEQVVFKDGAKAVIKGHGAGFHSLADFVGHGVLVIIPETEPSLESGHDVKPDKDQADLPLNNS